MTDIEIWLPIVDSNPWSRIINTASVRMKK